MQIKYFLFYLLVALVSTISVKAQDWSGTTYKSYQPAYGFVILNNGDTVKGYIMHGDRVSNQKNCIFYDDVSNKRTAKTYKPADIKGYFVGDKMYHTIHFSGGLLSKPLSFVLLRKSGKIAQYVYYTRDDNLVFIMRKEGESEAQFDERISKDESVLLKEGQEPLQQASLVFGFAKKMSKLVEDYPDLANKIINKEKGYGLLNMLNIVDEYNLYSLGQK